MQNLTTMNLVDVILHTRVPPDASSTGRDQAFLLIHLDKTDRTELNLPHELRQEPGKRQQGQQDGATTRTEPCAESGAAARLNLRRVGIRTATDLLKAFSKEAQQPRLRLSASLSRNRKISGCRSRRVSCGCSSACLALSRGWCRSGTGSATGFRFARTRRQPQGLLASVIKSRPSDLHPSCPELNASLVQTRKAIPHPGTRQGRGLCLAWREAQDLESMRYSHKPCSPMNFARGAMQCMGASV